MSPFLVKMYGFFALMTLVIASYFFQKTPSITHQNSAKKVTTQEKKPESQLEEQPTLATSTHTEKQIKEEVKNPVTSFATTTILTISNEPKNNPSSQENVELDYQSLGQQSNTCTSPIIYSLGSFDTKFNISKSHFLQIVRESTTLWSNALGTNLFEYDASGNPNNLTIDLIYDERQAQTDKNKLLAEEIDNSRNAANQVEADYEALKVIFTRIKNEYLSEVETFNTRQKKYNDTVSYWNTQGGAPKTDYDALTLEKQDLENVAVTLTQKHDTLAAMLTEINTKITRHNELVSFANQKINENNSSAHKKFTEGNYNSGTNKIIIYQFMDEIKLKRVITHELGHALGIGHTESKQSIMYAINTATSTMLDKEDITALQLVCQKQ